MRTGIPTKSKGYNMRSRLEARWAEFFTQMGWVWEYEPFDLPGWIPDFSIRTHDDKLLLVEVKPPSVADEIKKCTDALECAKLDCMFFVCGTGPYVNGNDHVVIGAWIGSAGHWDSREEGRWEEYDDVALVDSRLCEKEAKYTGEKDRGYGVCESVFSYADRITGHYCKGVDTPHWPTIQTIWADGCNRTQWRSGQ